LLVTFAYGIIFTVCGQSEGFCGHSPFVTKETPKATQDMRLLKGIVANEKQVYLESW